MTNRGQCAYCGRKKASTRDHVPPKCIFLRPLPEYMITVPSCEECQGSSKDDEYFMIVMLIAVDADTAQGYAEFSKSRKQRLERKLKEMHRVLGRREFSGLARRIQRQSTVVPAVTAENLMIPHRPLPLLFPENQRIARVGERIVRGLFFHEKAYRVPDQYSVIVKSGQFNRDPRTVSYLNEEIIPHTVAGYGSIQDSVFAFRYWEVGEDKDSTLWLMEFYGAPLLLGATSSRSLQLDT